ncbi:MucBP domain-containing protein [Gemella sp. GH3]|uniref:MucBP domain-containing protein n=1 Tax=unclassified Gemella TaxID=2624949 RepID=UPI0015D070CF|nr:MULTISPECIES: MucBP domain-containing protein [unclassified Gemella]MBF0713360.1 MucBP domain-containing protein [Gemella sp. GH3.1]NYS50312.1 MucBP domain-containing protein [Gemella sp. GH3]
MAKKNKKILSAVVMGVVTLGSVQSYVDSNNGYLAYAEGLTVEINEVSAGDTSVSGTSSVPGVNVTIYRDDSADLEYGTATSGADGTFTISLPTSAQNGDTYYYEAMSSDGSEYTRGYIPVGDQPDNNTNTGGSGAGSDSSTNNQNGYIHYDTMKNGDKLITLTAASGSKVEIKDKDGNTLGTSDTTGSSVGNGSGRMSIILNRSLKAGELITLVETNNASGYLSNQSFAVVEPVEVVTKYIDINTKEVIAPEERLDERSGTALNYGESYNTTQKDIANYTFKKVDGETAGTVTDTTKPNIEVTYYYAKNVNVTARYLKTDGTPLADNVVTTGAMGDEYSTEFKSFDNYEIEYVNGPMAGTYKDDVTVTYVYREKLTSPTITAEPGTKVIDGKEVKGTIVTITTPDGKVTEHFIPDGAKGDKGDKGETGAQGEKGDKGETGAQGEKGEKGETGAQGDKGDKGETGAQGEKGDKGETGAQGEKGDKGETGAQGEKGDKGDKGDPGKDGANGKDGKDGKSATIKTEPGTDENGNTGSWIIIVNGDGEETRVFVRDGKDGVNGKDGADGKSATIKTEPGTDENGNSGTWFIIVNGDGEETRVFVRDGKDGKDGECGCNPSNPGTNPNNPGGENPSNPGTNPNNPGGEDPSNPGTNPSNPGGENPSNPGTNPNNPGGEDPSNPGGQTPGNPGENNPRNPGGQTPGNPGENNPRNPGGQTPGNSGGDNSETKGTDDKQKNNKKLSNTGVATTTTTLAGIGLLALTLLVRKKIIK